MSKNCPKCGKTVADNIHFCSNCGYDFQTDSSQNSISGYGKIFAVLIAFIVVIGALVILNFGMNIHSQEPAVTVAEDDGDIDLTISEVSGYKYDDVFTIHTSAFFSNIPSDLKGYMIKTTYFDSKDERIGQQTDSLSNIIIDTDDWDYPHYFGYYDSHKKLDPEYVTVEIIKNKEVIVNDTFEVDRNSIEYL